MKKARFVLIAIIALLVCAISFSACEKHPEKWEVIPTVFGEPEGLWMYCGNTRSRTDASEETQLMETVTVDGEDYAADDFTIKNYSYMTSASKVFFVLSCDNEDITDAYFLYVYDYKEREGKYVAELKTSSTKIEIDDKNKLARFYNEYEDFLCDSQGNIVYRFKGDLSDDELRCRSYYGKFTGFSNGVFHSAYRLGKEVLVGGSYKWQYSYWIEWWKNGETHRIEIDDDTDLRIQLIDINATDTHLVIIVDRGTNAVLYSINLETETLVRVDAKNFDYPSDNYVKSYGKIGQFCYSDDAVYVLMHVNFYDNENNGEAVFYFFKISDEITKVAEIGLEGNYSSDMFCYDGSIYVDVCFSGRLKHKYFRYDMANDKCSSIFVINYNTALNNKKSAVPRRSEKRVGDYTFYVTSQGYGTGAFLGEYTGYCYYLNREHNGETEIVNCSFSSSKFFDDICTF